MQLSALSRARSVGRWEWAPEAAEEGACVCVGYIWLTEREMMVKWEHFLDWAYELESMDTYDVLREKQLQSKWECFLEWADVLESMGYIRGAGRKVGGPLGTHVVQVTLVYFWCMFLFCSQRGVSDSFYKGSGSVWFLAQILWGRCFIVYICGRRWNKNKSFCVLYCADVRIEMTGLWFEGEVWREVVWMTLKKTC